MALILPVELMDTNRRFSIRPYSKYTLRTMYGETQKTFLRYYLNDPETKEELLKLGYKSRSKVLSRKMVETIIHFHGEP